MDGALLSNRRIWTAAACATLILFGGLGLVLSIPGYRPRDVLLRRLERQTPHTPETELLPHVRRMAALGDEGVAAVTRLLASRRASEVDAARVVLAEQMDRWRLLTVEASAPRAVGLAEALTKIAPPPSAQGQGTLRELAARLLLWPARDAAQAERLLSCCEQVLRGGSSETPFLADAREAPVGELPGPPLPSPPRHEPPPEGPQRRHGKGRPRSEP